MKNEDNRINIGNNNKIRGSIIGNNTQIKDTELKSSEGWYSKLFWKLFIPVIVIVIAAAICLWVGIK
jgi:NDP-sugar pyrophosphorylase family protein